MDSEQSKEKETMNTVQRIAKNTGVLLISRIASGVLGFFFVMYTARYLGAEGFGILSFALAFTGIFGVFSDLGLSTLTVREVAREKTLASKYLGNIAVMKLILVIITLGLLALIINLLGYPEQTVKVVYLVALSVFLNAFSGLFYSIFQAFERMEFWSVGTILNSASLLVGALFAISHGLSVVGFALIYFLASAIVLGYGAAILIGKFAKPKIEVDWRFWKSTIKEALPFGLTSISILIYYQIDKVMLSLMVNNKVVGYYSAAYVLVSALLFFYGAFHSSIFPLMSKFYLVSNEAFKLTFQKSVKYLWIIALPIGAGTTLLANRFIILIYGSGYAPSVIALQILVWAHVIVYMNSFACVLNNIGKQILVTKQTVFCAFLNIIMNLILIPKYSYIGASIATVITEFFAFLILDYYVSKTEFKLSNKNFSIIFLQIIIATLVMAIFIIHYKSLNLAVLVLLSMIIFFITLYFIKGIDKEDIQFVVELIKGSTGRKVE